ncbi:unnamed protein product, partial [Didymodactylos carnosus]
SDNRWSASEEDLTDNSREQDIDSNETLVEDGEAVNIDNLIESDVENNSEDEDQENSELNIEDEDK